jgi:hypothetical protein
MKTLALLVLLVASTPAPSEAQAPARTTVVRELRARLDQLRASEEPRRFGRDLDVAPLVGMTRDQIRAALGAPSICGGPGYRIHDPRGNWAPTAPCRTPEDWYYSFYRLPPRSVGGGTELLLQFDAAGVCTVALWRGSR